MARSKILERGYINVYSKLTSQEKRVLFYQRKYKKLSPKWDQTNIVLCQYFKKYGEKLVLDAGCGHGNYVIDEFRDKIEFAAGVDIDSKSTTKNSSLDEIKYSNLETIPYPNNSFETVVSLWVLEHLENPSRVLREIRRVLKPGGCFIFVTPNKNNWLLKCKGLANQSLVKWVNKKFYGREEKDVFMTYYRANTMDKLEKLLKEAGYKIVKLQTNYDPGYTSFNEVTFRLSNLLSDQHHILGVARK